MLKEENFTNKNSYDEVPYISKSFANTQAEKLKNIVRLFGFEAPNIENARVLEIGCSFGGNLIPMAIENPNMELIGFDLSGKEIFEGSKLIERIGLKNIHLKEKDILEYDNSYGKFDYIICHGVFSWVPKIVQDKILSIVKDGLKENGLAVISYNTNPGWKNLSMIRDGMLFREKAYARNKSVETPKQIVERGKKFIEFLKDYAVKGKEVSSQIEEILKKTDYYIYHEYYENYNEAFYLYEMQEYLEKHGLTHICDSDINKSIPIYNGDDVDMEAILNKESLGNRIDKEQFYDFLFNQQFRSSIITHRELEDKFKVSHTIDKRNLKMLYVRQTFKKNKNGLYLYDDGREISKEIQKLAAFLSKIYPNNIKISELANMKELGDEDMLCSNILNLIYYKKVEISNKSFVCKEEKKPKLNEKIRKYITYFVEEENPIISLSAGDGRIIDLDGLQKEMLLELDGTKDKDSLVDLLLKRWENGEIDIKGGDGVPLRELLANYVDSIFFIIKRFNWFA